MGCVAHPVEEGVEESQIDDLDWTGERHVVVVPSLGSDD